MTKIILVEFVDIGYRKAIPKDKITALKITIKQLDFTKNLTGVYWRQLDPSVSYNYDITGFNKSATKNKFIFNDILAMDNQTGYLNSSYASMALRSNSFKY